jgi:hypothetical protein
VPGGQAFLDLAGAGWRFINSPEAVQLVMSTAPYLSTFYFGASLFFGQDIVTGEKITDANLPYYAVGFGLSVAVDFMPALAPSLGALRGLDGALSRLVPRAGEAINALKGFRRGIGGVFERAGLSSLLSREAQAGSIDLGKIAEQFGGLSANGLGQTVSPLGRTYERYSSYLTDVARHYGINLRGVKASL